MVGQNIFSLKSITLSSVITLAMTFAFSTNANAVTGAYVSTTPGSTYQCRETLCIVGSVVDTSLPSSTIACETSETICYETFSYSGGSTSLSRMMTSCMTCPDGYTLTTKTMDSTQVPGCTVTYNVCTKQLVIVTCPDECPSTSWTDDENQTGRQIRCNRLEGKCEYQCKTGYYNASTSSTGTTCRTCPSNGQCVSGSVCCNVGYYSETKTQFVQVGQFYQQLNVTTCPRCPALENVYGTTSRTSLCANDIAQCYIPANTEISTTEGRYEFTSDCNYSEFTIIDPTPIEPGN